MMAELRGAGPAIRPVPAGMVSAVGISPAIRLRSGDHLFLLGRVAAPFNRVPFFGERRVLIDFIAERGNLHRVSMQIPQVLHGDTGEVARLGNNINKTTALTEKG